MALDIDERHLLRLGHGEEALETEKDFSRSVYLVRHNEEYIWLKNTQIVTQEQTICYKSMLILYLSGSYSDASWSDSFMAWRLVWDVNHKSGTPFERVHAWSSFCK